MCVEKYTNLPPQTYFLTKRTPPATLSSMTIMTVTTMGTDLERGFFTCKNNSRGKIRQKLQEITKREDLVCRGTDQECWTQQVTHASLSEIDLFTLRGLPPLTLISRDFPVTVNQTQTQNVPRGFMKVCTWCCLINRFRLFLVQWTKE